MGRSTLHLFHFHPRHLYLLRQLYYSSSQSTDSNFYKDSATTADSDHGTLTDADGDSVEATGQIDGSFDFNGDADSISVADSTSLRIASSFTVSAWFKADTFPGANTITSISDKSDFTSETAGLNSNYFLTMDNNLGGAGTT